MKSSSPRSQLFTKVQAWDRSNALSRKTSGPSQTHRSVDQSAVIPQSRSGYLDQHETPESGPAKARKVTGNEGEKEVLIDEVTREMAPAVQCFYGVDNIDDLSTSRQADHVAPQTVPLDNQPVSELLAKLAKFSTSESIAQASEEDLRDLLDQEHVFVTSGHYQACDRDTLHFIQQRCAQLRIIHFSRWQSNIRSAMSERFCKTRDAGLYCEETEAHTRYLVYSLPILLSHPSLFNLELAAKNGLTIETKVIDNILLTALENNFSPDDFNAIAQRMDTPSLEKLLNILILTSNKLKPLLSDVFDDLKASIKAALSERRRGCSL